MKNLKIASADKALIKAYFKWTIKKGYYLPSEYEMSQLIENLDCNHRMLVKEYLEELKSEFEVQ